MYDVENRYEQAAMLLPAKFRAAALGLPESKRRCAEELRLRAGRGLFAVISGKEITLQHGASQEDVLETVARAAQGSLHSASDSLADGFVTAPGGHRVGVCGTAIVENGKVCGMRSFTSASIRISKELKGIGKELYSELAASGVLRSTLIVAPPGVGKTSLLRDLVRLISESGLRVGVADERKEISGLGEDPNASAFDLGRHTDVLCGAPKAEAALMLLRTMSPVLIAMDEITDPEDIEAAEKIAHCGVALYATIHARDSAEIATRRGHESINRIFSRCIFIERCADGGRRYLLEECAQ